MTRRMLLIGLLLLSGCTDWQAPSWMAGNNSQPAATLPPPPQPVTLAYVPAPPPRMPGFSITTGTEGDPRWDASLRCGKDHRYAVLRQTQLNRTGQPDKDTITWYFDCTY